MALLLVCCARKSAGSIYYVTIRRVIDDFGSFDLRVVVLPSIPGCFFGPRYYEEIKAKRYCNEKSGYLVAMPAVLHSLMSLTRLKILNISGSCSQHWLLLGLWFVELRRECLRSSF